MSPALMSQNGITIPFALARTHSTMDKTFEAIGYLSPEIETFRNGARTAHSAEFEMVEGTVQVALADLHAMEGGGTEAYVVGLGYWLRCVESCQGAILLSERGMSVTAFSALRIAYESLFYACALWRQPALTERVETLHHLERIKQARGMMRAGAAQRVPTEKLLLLKGVAEEMPPSESGLSAWEAAEAAGLLYEYEDTYRGCSLAGAHASIRSLDDFYVEAPDGGFSMCLEPNDKRLVWQLSLVNDCLQHGIERRRDAHARYCS